MEATSIVGRHFKPKLQCMLLLMSVTISPARSTSVQAVHGDQCHPWSFYNDTLQDCQSYSSPGEYLLTISESDALKCSEKGTLVMLGFCVTNEDKGTFIVYCGSYRFYDRTATVTCLLYTSPSPRDATLSRMPSSA